MTIKDLKIELENNSYTSDGYIFKYNDTSFIPIQYITKISQLSNRDIEYVNSLDMVLHLDSIFGKVDSNNIKVFITDKLIETIALDEFCYVICKECKNNSFIDVPKLEEWQIFDYAITNSSKSIPNDDITSLVKACDYNLYYIDNEISKYNIFNEISQKTIFDQLNRCSQFKESYSDTIFDFVSAILDHNLDLVKKIYENLTEYDFDTMALISIIKKQLRNIIVVGFNKSPTEQNTGLSSKQIYWIKKNLYKYEAKSIVSHYVFMCDIENYLMKGILSSQQLFDYIVINLLL